MSALAMILAKNGYSISGSDQKISSILRELAGNNINIFQNQEESNIDKISKETKNNILIVISSAIRADNLELKAAKKYNLQIKHRSEILKFLIDQIFSNFFPWASQGTPGTSQGPRENFRNFLDYSKILDFFIEFSWIFWYYYYYY